MITNSAPAMLSAKNNLLTAARRGQPGAPRGKGEAVALVKGHELVKCDGGKTVQGVCAWYLRRLSRPRRNSIEFCSSTVIEHCPPGIVRQAPSNVNFRQASPKFKYCI